METIDEQVQQRRRRPLLLPLAATLRSPPLLLSPLFHIFSDCSYYCLCDCSTWPRIDALCGDPRRSLVQHCALLCLLLSSVASAVLAAPRIALHLVRPHCRSPPPLACLPTPRSSGRRRSTSDRPHRGERIARRSLRRILVS